jgi:hypothetical protein
VEHRLLVRERIAGICKWSVLQPEILVRIESLTQQKDLSNHTSKTICFTL